MSIIPIQVPDIGTPLFDPRTGFMNPVWFQYFQILVLRTGGESGDADGDFAAEILVLQNRATDSEGSGASFVAPLNQPYPTEPQWAEVACVFVPQDAEPVPISTHGQQYDPSLHALVTVAADGFMSAADKVKLDGIVGGVTSCFMVYQNAAQAIGLGVQTAINFTTVVFDDTSEFSIGSTAFVAANTGTYCFNAGVAGSQVTATRRQLSIYVNGVQRIVVQDSTGNGGNCAIAGTSGPMKLSAGDIVQVRYFTGIAENTSPGQTFTYFGGWRIK